MTVVNYDLIEQNVALITLNRPYVSNAMSLELLDQLNLVVNKVKKNESIHTVVLTGTGERAFCAGADLKEREALSEKEVLSRVKYISETISKIESIKVPVIGLINGAAIGGGLELALACDIRLAYNHATFGLTETSLAIIPGAGGTQRLARLIGIGQAKRLIYSSEIVTAEQAFRMNLIEKIVDQQDQITNIPLIKAISQNGPLALKYAKQAINQGFETNLQTGLDIEHLCYTSIVYSEDRREGLKAFKEKRKPLYHGK